MFLGRGQDRAGLRERRAGKSTLSVRVDNDLVSQSHALLTRTDGAWTIEDAGSKNGTLAGGKRITGRVTLRPGDTLQIGHVFVGLRDSVARANAGGARDVLDAEAAGALALPGFPTLLPALAEEVAGLKTAARSSDAVSIVGATGTGKEVLANALHACSGRSGPFGAVNCAALAANLVEAQLFGYVKGAYSGADAADPGFIRSAHRGTLLLDEILDLPLPAQAKLLRVLQQGEVVPLGTSRGHQVDVRFLAATQRQFSEAAASGAFRADLQARLERHIIELPPLSERREDLGLLTAAILRQHGAGERTRLPARAVQQMLGYSWPLNVRELENALVRALRREKDGVLDAAAFPHPDTSQRSADQVVGALSEDDRLLRNRLAALLETHRGNVSAVAREEGKHKEQVYRWLRRLDLDPEVFRE